MRYGQKGSDIMKYDFLDHSEMIANSAYQMQQQMAEIEESFKAQAEYRAQKDAAIFQAAEESKKQNKLLSEQIDTLKEQNKLLKEMYDGAKVDAEENKKQAKHNKIFGWVSFAVGTAIGIAGILVGILL